MALNLSIKNVPDDVAERLRQRAARNRRSLQGELLAIVETASLSSGRSVATVDDLYEWGKAHGLSTGSVVDEIRQMREERTDELMRRIERPGTRAKRTAGERRR